MSNPIRGLFVVLFLAGGISWAAEPAAEGTDTAGTMEERLAKLEKQVAAQANDFRLYWKNGVRFDTNDGAFKMKLGGRVHADAAFYEVSPDVKNAIGDSADGVELRRVRLALAGTLYKHFEFKTQYDFVGSGRGVFKDVYVGVKSIPSTIPGTEISLPNIRIGHFKEPFSLEELTSSNDITIMERSLPTTFAPSRNVGVMLHKNALDKRLLWAVGLFRDTNDFGKDTGDGKYNLTARVTGLPYFCTEDGYKLAHVGIAYSVRNTDGTVSFSERPESHLAARLVDTGAFDAGDEHRIGLEAAVVLNSLSLQGEYITSQVNGQGGVADMGFHAFYIMGSYFLTGEHRPYKESTGAFTRVKPTNNVFEGGSGAWEAALRYSYIDLDGRTNQVEGGLLHDITAGLNWYLNGNYRVTCNYVYSILGSVDDMHTVQFRFQVAF